MKNITIGIQPGLMYLPYFFMVFQCKFDIIFSKVNNVFEISVNVHCSNIMEIKVYFQHRKSEIVEAE